MSYDDAHCRCPSCGSADVDREHGSAIHVAGTQFRDTNRAVCECGWEGIVDDLHGKRMLGSKKSCPLAIKSPVEIAMAHDILVMLHNGQTPIDAGSDENKLMIAAQADVLGWVLGEPNGFTKMLDDLKAACSEAGVEFVPRSEVN